MLRYIFTVIRARFTKKEPQVWAFERVLEDISNRQYYICVSLESLNRRGLITRKQWKAAKQIVNDYLDGKVTITTKLMDDGTIPRKEYNNASHYRFRFNWLMMQLYGTKPE